MTTTRASASTVASWIGYAGLIPFVASLALCYLGDPPAQQFGIRALGAYAAVILSFIGGIHWGVATQNTADDTAGWYVGSVVPSLLGWVALLLRPSATMAALLLCFLAWYVFERMMPVGRMFPVWFVRLRLRLTSGAVVTLLLGWLRTLSAPI